MKKSTSNPSRIFAGLCVACALGLTGYIRFASKRALAPPPASESLSQPATSLPQAATPKINDFTPVKAFVETARESEPIAGPGRIFFRYNAVDSHYGKLAFIEYGHAAPPHFIDALSCEVAYVAGGRGICLKADRGVFTTYTARLFDAKTFRTLAEVPLQGIPSRCRLSSDGRVAASTVFVSGHSYASIDFTTQTLLMDAASGKVLANVEDYSVTRDGTPFSNQDFNYWGVTFTPGAKQFYCTLSTNRKHFLVKADIDRRSATVIHENVECPSLSPDGTRIAYKKRFMVNGRIVWQLHILDLNTGAETPLNENRSVDDQLEWLDNNRVLYTLPESETSSSASTNIWVSDADGRTPPEIFLKKAYSPSVVSIR